MPVERIIILREDKYSKFNHDRFGIDILEERGLAVEYWDCSRIFRAQFQGTHRVEKKDGFSGLRYFDKRDFLLGRIASLTPKDVLITELTPTIKTLKLLRYIAGIKAFWGMVRLGDLPIPQSESSFLSRIEKLIRKPSVGVNFLLRKVPPEKLGLRALDFILLGGASPVLGGPGRMINENTKFIDAHSSDYDRCLLETREKGKADCPKKVVFLDHGGPFHRDQFFFNVPFPCSTEEYFSNLNSFFRLIEKKFGWSVVVAGHPRVDYKEKGNPFEGREIVQGETHRWVKTAHFVINFCSTTVSFAVIYKKPIVFLEINPKKRNVFDPLGKSIANKLGKSSFYWAGKGEVDWDRELKINHDCYDQYMESYIKKQGSPENSCWEILADYLMSKDG